MTEEDGNKSMGGNLQFWVCGMRHNSWNCEKKRRLRSRQTTLKNSQFCLAKKIKNMMCPVHVWKKSLRRQGSTNSSDKVKILCFNHSREHKKSRTLFWQQTVTNNRADRLSQQKANNTKPKEKKNTDFVTMQAVTMNQ